tara:strand:- start:88 stop:864 length:777 start_codon:yes stop_codon:yes gene_type:complete
MSANNELVTYADLQDGPSDFILRIQQQHGCSMEVARLAYGGFTLYIPHLWVGTKTHPDGTLKGEGLVYGVMRNLGLGFLTKTTEAAKAINITLRKGENGKRDHQSCKIHFDRLFTRGEENAGNIAILEHLLGGKTNERTGRDVYNHLEIIYQEAGPNRYTGNDDPARFWKVFLWRPAPETVEKPASPAPASPRVRFTLVTASDNSLPNSAAPVTRRVHFPTPAESVTPPATAPAPSFEEQQLAEDGFTTVGRGGGTAN